MMPDKQLLACAAPAEYFNNQPYRAELFSQATVRAGVMNAHGVNVLTFTDKPGAVLTDYASAVAIAEDWNVKYGKFHEPN